MRTAVLILFLAAFTAVAAEPEGFEQVPIPAEASECPVQFQTKKNAGAALLVACAIIAGCIIFYAYKEDGDPEGPHVYVLEESHRDDNWHDVATITIGLSPKKAKAILAARVHHEPGDVYVYRLKDLGPATY